MAAASNHRGNTNLTSTPPDRTQTALADLARELVDKVGIEGATRYCHSLGWFGVLHQIELLNHSKP